jgi:hypothetical protein
LAEVHWYEAHGIGRVEHKNKRFWSREMESEHHNYVLCIDHGDWPASLKIRKVYPCLPDAKAAEHLMLRVIDESGEDYHYPESCFVRIELPQRAERAFASAA